MEGGPQISLPCPEKIATPISASERGGKKSSTWEEITAN